MAASFAGVIVSSAIQPPTLSEGIEGTTKEKGITITSVRNNATALQFILGLPLPYDGSYLLVQVRCKIIRTNWRNLEVRFIVEIPSQIPFVRASACTARVQSSRK